MKRVKLSMSIIGFTGARIYNPQLEINGLIFGIQFRGPVYI